MADQETESTDESRKRQDVAVPRLLTGRKPVTTAFSEITADNVCEVIQEAKWSFWGNIHDCEYLWAYYKGNQPILSREKDVRPEINNKVVENHAQEIVSFKIGYQLGEPIQYIYRKQVGDTDEQYSAGVKLVNVLNTLMFSEGKESADRDVFEWMCVCGYGFRMVEVDKDCDEEEGSAPFELFTLDPRQTFVIRSRDYHSHVVAGVWIGLEPGTNRCLYNVFTKDMLYVCDDKAVISAAPHTYGRVPIIEYPLNNARLGAFEVVLPLLDAINNAESNRLDDIEQTVQSLIVFNNCNVAEEDVQGLYQLGAIKVKSTDAGIKSSVDMLKTDLDQAGTQQVKDDLYQAVVNIVGMPNRNQGAGSNDTGAAVLLRDGWALAESLAKSYELQFARSEREMLRVALEVCRQAKGIDLDLLVRDIDLKFNRRQYENALVKSQTLTTMLDCGKIHPQLAFQSCGLFTDSDAAYELSAKYAEEQQEKARQAPAEPSDEPQKPDSPGPQAAVPEPGSPE